MKSKDKASKDDAEVTEEAKAGGAAKGQELVGPSHGGGLAAKCYRREIEDLMKSIEQPRDKK